MKNIPALIEAWNTAIKRSLQSSWRDVCWHCHQPTHPKRWQVGLLLAIVVVFLILLWRVLVHPHLNWLP